MPRKEGEKIVFNGFSYYLIITIAFLFVRTVNVITLIDLTNDNFVKTWTKNYGKCILIITNIE